MNNSKYSLKTIDTLNKKRKQVAEYISLWENYPKQGSAEWILMKQDYIGGSEIATLLGINIFSKINDLIIKKSIGSGFSGSIKTRWGNIFEILVTKYVEYDKNTQVLGDDIFIIGNIQHQAYSPDGLGVMMFTELESIDDFDYVQHDIPKIILFEFKSPYNRIPNGYVPKYYVPQVKSGLDTIEMTEAGLFVEGVFRRCYWEDLGNNRKFLNNFKQLDPGGPCLPFSYGFMIFYLDRTSDLISDLIIDLIIDLENEIEKQLGDDFADFAEADEQLLDKLFALVVDHKIMNIYYSDLLFGDNDYSEELFWNKRNELEANNNIKTFGVLSWKLINIYYHTISKDVGYLEDIEPIIKDTMEKIKYYKSNPDKINDLTKDKYANFADTW